MKYLPLINSDHSAIVDDDVFLWARFCKWRLHSKGYVQESGGSRGYLHRIVMGASDSNVKIDHIFGNKLDNRKSELRLATAAQNLWNAGVKKHNKCGFKGVYKCNFTGRWRSEIRVNGHVLKIGRFDSIVEAAKAYDQAALLHHGEFANLNFPFELGCGS